MFDILRNNMISVIIPVYNESVYLSRLLPFIRKNSGDLVGEIIVVDAYSSDDTVEVCKNNKVKVISSPVKKRSAQMNTGAALASNDILYFLHADTLPPANFAATLNQAFAEGTEIARYRSQFQSNSLLLKCNAFFTRFDIFMCYGGDNSLAVSSVLFKTINGFDESLAIMEDYDITERARKAGSYAILKDYVLVSARKYEKNSWIAVQKANYKAVKMYKKGVKTPIIAELYRNSLKF